MLSKDQLQQICAIASMAHHHGTFGFLVDCDGSPALAHHPAHRRVIYDFG